MRQVNHNFNERHNEKSKYEKMRKGKETMTSTGICTDVIYVMY